MERGLTGHYVDSIAGGVRCQAFIPESLPPRPLDGKLQRRINHAMLALGRLDAIPAILKRFRQSVLAAAVSGG